MKNFSTWLKALSAAKQVGLGVAIFIVLVIVVGGSSQPKTNVDKSLTSKKSQSASKGTDSKNLATKSKIKPSPVVTSETETQSIPFTSTTVNDNSMAKGQSKITTVGIAGVATLTYKVTDGQESTKQLVSNVVTTPPVTQVTSIGTYVAPVATKPACDPNYSGACVPNVYPSDVDCAGGSGNGPYYVRGPVHVIGTDRYGLDRDGDGIACE